MSLHTWSRVNQHISHKSSGPFQRYKHNITFLTAEVFHKFLFCTRKRQHFIPWQVPNSYTGKIFTGDGQQVNFLNVFFFSSFFLSFFVNTVPWRQQWSNNAFVVVYPIYFSSSMKHKTENTHKTHYKAAVRLQWRDSMAQHGRLVVSCTGTLRILPTQENTSALVSGPRRWSVRKCGYHQHEDRANYYCGITVHVPYR